MWNVSRICDAQISLHPTETELANASFLVSTGLNPMPKESPSDPRHNFVPRWLPWCLGALMLVVYCATLSHWITLLNISQVALVAGWSWQHALFSPLTFLATLPFR